MQNPGFGFALLQLKAQRKHLTKLYSKHTS